LKSVILCGGRGSRLQETTQGLSPKPMVEVGERPMLWHIMKIYDHFGFTEFVLCLGHLSYVIKQYFLNFELQHSDITIDMSDRKNIVCHKYHSPFNWKVTLAETGLDSMTGSRIARIEPYVNNDTFMLTYGDGVADIDLKKLLEFHRSTVINAALHDQPVRMTKGEQLRDFCFVDDIANTFIEAAQTTIGDHELFNLGTGKGISLKDAAQTIIKVIGKKVPVLLGDQPYRKKEAYSLIADTVDLPPYLNNCMKTSFETGIKKTLEWIKNRNNIETNK